MNKQAAHALAEIWARQIPERGPNRQLFTRMMRALEAYVPNSSQTTAISDPAGALALVERGVVRIDFQDFEQPDGEPAIVVRFMPTEGVYTGRALVREEIVMSGYIQSIVEWSFDLAGETLKLTTRRGISEPIEGSDEMLCREVARRIGWDVPLDSGAVAEARAA